VRRFYVSPLTHRLVGRPAQERMTVAYAQPCVPYCGTVCLDDFTPEALSDPEILALARRLTVVADSSPLRPLSADAARAKFAMGSSLSPFHRARTFTSAIWPPSLSRARGEGWGEVHL
jgi:hypothetical protein